MLKYSFWALSWKVFLDIPLLEKLLLTSETKLTETMTWSQSSKHSYHNGKEDAGELVEGKQEEFLNMGLFSSLKQLLHVETCYMQTSAPLK